MKALVWVLALTLSAYASVVPFTRQAPVVHANKPGKPGTQMARVAGAAGLLQTNATSNYRMVTIPSMAFLKSAVSNRYLYAQGGKEGEAGIGAAPNNSKRWDDQKWILELHDPDDPDDNWRFPRETYFLRNAHSNRYLYSNGKDRSFEENVPLIHPIGAAPANSKRSDNQRWYLDYNYWEGTYKLQNAVSYDHLYALDAKVGDWEAGVGAGWPGSYDLWEWHLIYAGEKVGEGQCTNGKLGFLDPYQNYRKYHRKMDTETDCEAFCAATSHCNYFTYYPPAKLHIDDGECMIARGPCENALEPALWKGSRRPAIVYKMPGRAGPDGTHRMAALSDGPSAHKLVD